MIKEDLKKIKTAIPENVKLVAVSKTKPVPITPKKWMCRIVRRHDAQAANSI